MPSSGQTHSGTFLSLRHSLFPLLRVQQRLQLNPNSKAVDFSSHTAVTWSESVSLCGLLFSHWTKNTKEGVGVPREEGEPRRLSAGDRKRVVRFEANAGLQLISQGCYKGFGLKRGTFHSCPSSQSSPRRPQLETQLSPPSDSGFGCPPAHTQGRVQCPIHNRKGCGGCRNRGLLPASPPQKAWVGKDRSMQMSPVYLPGHVTLYCLRNVGLGCGGDRSSSLCTEHSRPLVSH